MPGDRSSTYSLTHLSDHVLLRNLTALVARENTNTAELVAHIAEVDARRLYVPAGYPSMRAYCIEVLRLCEDAAYKRIQAARTAREFPAIFEALADGRLHLSAVCLLATHLTSANADGLLAVAVHKTKAEIQRLLAERFPQSEMLGLVETLPTEPPTHRAHLAQETVGVSNGSPGRAGVFAGQLAPGQVHALVDRSMVKPLAPQRFALQATISQVAYDKFQYIQALLSHQIPSGDVAEVLEFTFDAAIEKLEKRKFAASTRARPSRRHSIQGKRYIPADVKRAVWDRDGGRCTFVSETGHRCQARKFLEFDHVNPVARGGESTVEGLGLRCRAHNQYAAECAFGTEFMRRKREDAQRAAEERAGAAQARAQADAAVEEIKQDVMCALRNLGYRADQARDAAARCDDIPDVTFEERIRIALSVLCPRTVSHRRAVIPEPAT